MRSAAEFAAHDGMGPRKRKTRSPPDDRATPSSAGRKIRITIGNTRLTAKLDDNATARDLAAQLPLTLTFRDHNGVEKTAPLPRKLSVERAPAGHNPKAGEIGYWAPDVFTTTTTLRLGTASFASEFDGDVDAVAREIGDFRATVPAAE